MEIIKDYIQIQDQINQVRKLKKGFLTNFYLTRKRCDFLIERQLMYGLKIENTYFLFQKDGMFFHLFYSTTNHEELNKSLSRLNETFQETLVVDIVGNKLQVSSIKEIFLKNNFSSYTSLNRMSKVVNVKEIDKMNANIFYGDLKDSFIVHQLLKTYFDPYSEQIPLLEEIEEWSQQKNVLVYKKEEQVVGFLIFEINGVTSYLRYWFVHPEFRELKIGSALLNQYFFESKNTSRQLFWVIESNENAIKRYKHYGFVSENLYDEILIYKNK